MNGDYALEDTVYIPFTTRAFATGIPSALTTGEVQIYEDASITQITTAETLSVDLDGVTGFNMCSVSATAANGFESGKSYTAMLSAGTVGGVSVVGEVVGQFTIEASAAAVDLANGTDGLGAILAAVNALNNLSAAQVNAEVDTALTDYDPPTKAELDAGFAALNDITAAAVWAAITDAASNKIADHVLRRTWANAEASSDGDAIAFRSLLGAVAKLVNRVAVSGANLLTYRDDDLTVLGTQALTTDAAADPITEIDTT